MKEVFELEQTVKVLRSEHDEEIKLFQRNFALKEQMYLNQILDLQSRVQKLEAFEAENKDLKQQIS